MKTLRLENEALDLAKRLAVLHNSAEEKLESLNNEINSTKVHLAGETSAIYTMMLKCCGLDPAFYLEHTRLNAQYALQHDFAVLHVPDEADLAMIEKQMNGATEQ